MSSFLERPIFIGGAIAIYREIANGRWIVPHEEPRSMRDRGPIARPSWPDWRTIVAHSAPNCMQHHRDVKRPHDAIDPLPRPHQMAQTLGEMINPNFEKSARLPRNRGHNQALIAAKSWLIRCRSGSHDVASRNRTHDASNGSHDQFNCPQF